MQLSRIYVRLCVRPTIAQVSEITNCGRRVLAFAGSGKDTRTLPRDHGDVDRFPAS
jgi:hypothetical protein